MFLLVKNNYKQTGNFNIVVSSDCPQHFSEVIKQNPKYFNNIGNGKEYDIFVTSKIDKKVLNL
jgi:hypothetical protein